MKLNGWCSRTRVVVATAAAMLSLAACDDTPTPPPEALMDETVDASINEPPPPPTTQELLNGPYKTLPLADLPLTLDVPQSWKIETIGASAIPLLQGDAPGGPVVINLSQRPRTTQEKIDIMLEGAQREMAEAADRIKKVELQKKGDLRLFERQALTRSSVPADPRNPDAGDLGPQLRWTITTYLPLGKDEFESYELTFIGLTASQFEQDEAFLRKIIDSLAVSAARATPPVEDGPEAAQPSSHSSPLSPATP